MNEAIEAIRRAMKTEQELEVSYMTQEGELETETYPMRRVLALLNKIEGMKYAIGYELKDVIVGSTEL